MLVHDEVVHVHRATEVDARGIAMLHTSSKRGQVTLARGSVEAGAASVDEDEHIWREALHLSSGDLRPWVAWRGDRLTGFVTVGPSRDYAMAPTVGEVYVLDVDPGEADGPVASELLEHACKDLASRGFREATIWISVRDESRRERLFSAGWSEDGTHRFERVRGVAILEFRYRKTLS